MTPPSPQLENGFSRIANETLEALARENLPAYEMRTLLALFRLTYGFSRKEASISVSKFQKLTGLKRQHQSRALKALEQRKIVTRIGDSFVSKWRFQKDYSKWETVTCRGDNTGKIQTVTCRGDGVSPVEVTKLSPVEVTHKRKKKSTKETGEPMPSKKELDSFLKAKAEEIYSLYPRKGNRETSIRHITRLIKTPPPGVVCGAGGLLLAVKKYRAEVEAKGTGPDFIFKPYNFFGRAAHWLEYLATDTEPAPAGDPFARNFT